MLWLYISHFSNWCPVKMLLQVLALWVALRPLIHNHTFHSCQNVIHMTRSDLPILPTNLKTSSKFPSAVELVSTKWKAEVLTLVRAPQHCLRTSSKKQRKGC